MLLSGEIDRCHFRDWGAKGGRITGWFPSEPRHGNTLAPLKGRIGARNAPLCAKTLAHSAIANVNYFDYIDSNVQ